MKHQVIRPPHCEARTPQQIRKDVARLMADGRARTSEDIAWGVSCSISQAQAAIRVMRDWGLVTSSVCRQDNRDVLSYQKSDRRVEDDADLAPVCPEEAYAKKLRRFAKKENEAFGLDGDWRVTSKDGAFKGNRRVKPETIEVIKLFTGGQKLTTQDVVFKTGSSLQSVASRLANSEKTGVLRVVDSVVHNRARVNVYAPGPRFDAWLAAYGVET